jgi:hypothetical protein
LLTFPIEDEAHVQTSTTEADKRDILFKGKAKQIHFSLFGAHRDIDEGKIIMRSSGNN